MSMLFSFPRNSEETGDKLAFSLQKSGIKASCRPHRYDNDAVMMNFLPGHVHQEIFSPKKVLVRGFGEAVGKDQI